MTRSVADLIKEDIQKIEEASFLAQLGAKAGAALGSNTASGISNRYGIEKELLGKWKRYISGSGDAPTVANLANFMIKHIGFNWKNTSNVFKKAGVDINKLERDIQNKKQQDKAEKDQEKKSQEQSQKQKKELDSRTANSNNELANRAANSNPPRLANSNTPPSNSNTNESIIMEVDANTVLDNNFIARFFDQTARYVISNNMLNGGTGRSNRLGDYDDDDDELTDTERNTPSQRPTGSERLNGQIDRQRMTKVAKLLGVDSTHISNLENEIDKLTIRTDITSSNGPTDLKKNMEKYLSDSSNATLLAKIGLSYLMSNGKIK